MRHGFLAKDQDGFSFSLACLAFKILLTLFPGLQSRVVGQLQNDFQLITPALAQQDQCVGDTAFAKGFKAAFGVRDQSDSFAVVVASAKSPQEALNKLKSNRCMPNPTLRLRVGPRWCSNDYYPVFATDYLPRGDAQSELEYSKANRNWRCVLSSIAISRKLIAATLSHETCGGAPLKPMLSD